MSIAAWLLVGFVAGGLAGMATGSRDRGCLGTIAVGVVGALLGGWLFRMGTGDDVDVFTGVSITSVLVAFVGAVVLLLILQVLGVDASSRRRRR